MQVYGHVVRVGYSMIVRLRACAEACAGSIETDDDLEKIRVDKLIDNEAA